MKKDKINGITLAAFQGYTHKHSIVVARRRDLVVFQAKQSEDAIANLTNALAKERRRLKDLRSEADGLTRVLMQRTSGMI